MNDLSPTSRVALADLTKRFGNLTAVDHLSLQLSPGEIFAFLGLNGAGKTTTIKLLVGLLAPTSGSVLIDGRDLARFPEEAKRIIGYVPDEPYLYEKLTGAEFLDFVGTLYGIPQQELISRREQMLETFRLTSVAYRLIETYSHGMRQRLVYAGVFLHEPRLLVVDEPTVGLDPEGMQLVKTQFRKLAASGATVFLSTHVLSLAQEIADRIGIIHRGKMLACGRSEDLIRQNPGCRTLEEGFLKLVERNP